MGVGNWHMLIMAKAKEKLNWICGVRGENTFPRRNVMEAQMDAIISRLCQPDGSGLSAPLVVFKVTFNGVFPLALIFIFNIHQNVLILHLENSVMNYTFSVVGCSFLVDVKRGLMVKRTLHNLIGLSKFRGGVRLSKTEFSNPLRT